MTEFELIKKETGLVYGKDYKNLNDIDWYCISQYQQLSESFIEKYADKVNWKLISEYQKLSEPFIEKYADKIDWFLISTYQQLSESFIEKYFNKLNPSLISLKQHLSETFIEKYINELSITFISECQILSEQFVEKHLDKLEPYLVIILQYQNLSNKFIKKHKNKLKEELSEKDIPLAIIHNCGNNNRVIRILPNKPKQIEIGCFTGTKQEAIKAIKKKYGNTKEGKEYINKVKKCFKIAENKLEKKKAIDINK